MGPSALTFGVLKAAARLAMSSDASSTERVERLMEVARAWFHSGAPGSDVPLTEAVAHLTAAADDPNADSLRLVHAAHSVGRLAESFRFQALARSAYELAVGLLGPSGDADRLGIVWRDIGDTFGAEGLGREALEAYHKAASYKARADDVLEHVITLAAVVDAEREWGTPEGCEVAFAAASARLAEALARPNVDLQVAVACALRVGSQAESLERFRDAREVFALTLGAVEAGAASPDDEAQILIALGRTERRLGDLDAAREHLQRAMELLEVHDEAELADAATEMRLVARALGDPAAGMADLLDVVSRLSAALGDFTPVLRPVLEEVASLASGAGDADVSLRCLEWALAIADSEGDDHHAESLIAMLPPIPPEAAVDAIPPQLPSPADLHTLGNPQRTWCFGLRRRAKQDEDIRALVAPRLTEIVSALMSSRATGVWDLPAVDAWLHAIYPADFELDEQLLGDRPRLARTIAADLVRAWDERESKLGTELQRALERFLLVRTVDHRWQEHVAACDREPEQSSGDTERGLTVALWQPFLTDLFNVEVEVAE